MSLHVESRGRGLDLVLLHGWGMNGAVWDELAAALAPDFRVHSVDLPGHGASAACNPYTLAGLTDALAAQLPERVMVCGWSLGAQLALTWARRDAHQVTRLVLIAGTPRFVTGADWRYGLAVEVLDTFAADLERDCGGTLHRFLALQAQGDDDARAVLRQLRARMRQSQAPDVAALAAGLRILKDSDLRGWLREVTQPALLVHGTRDGLAPPEAARYLQRELPNARLEMIDGAAHAPFATRNEHVAHSVRQFCRER